MKRLVIINLIAILFSLPLVESVSSAQQSEEWTGGVPDGLDGWRDNARILIEKNGLDEAEVYVKNILDWNPEDMEARRWWARIMGPAPSLIASNAQLQIVKLPDGQEISMKLVPGSTFNMGDTWGDGDGDEKPVHAITVFDFWMTTTEITNQQYATFLNAWGNQFEGAATWLDINDEDCQIVIKDGFFVGRAGFENNPVVEVTWFGARAFARWVRGRLPTEAEWEYAARNGGRNMKFATGADLSSNDANILGTMGRDRWEPSSPVASFASNILGLYDLSGNVWEWCQDWYAKEFYSNSRRTNPTGPLGGEARILRGGSWYDSSQLCRVSYRNMNRPDESRVNIGFRIVVPKQ